MFLLVCHECSYGDVKDKQSFCSREAVFSKHTRCIQKKALDFYMEQVSVTQLPVKVVNNW
ncbi:MAG: hypothetical protein OET08_12125 [Desulfuromonadales bacterium]|jgi:hypothetical protein|nr:hypothetical protein [Desulfuromonadales bacterium]